MDHLIPGRWCELVLINKKKIIWYLVGFADPVDHRMKMKESENINKYLDLARELIKLWKMKMTVMLIVVGAVPNGLGKKSEEESRPYRP